MLIVLSFNNSKSRVVWGGFTLKWYAECFKNETITNAFVTTIQITLAAAIISTLLGTLAAIGISAMKKKNKAIMLGATNIPLLNADIVTGIAMMLLFVKFMNLGFVTVLIAHITFDIPYVILNVLPKLNQANRYTYEAALDLGATPLYAFFRITVGVSLDFMQSPCRRTIFRSPFVKKVIEKSSSDMVTAIKNPENTPDLISGHVILKKA